MYLMNRRTANLTVVFVLLGLSIGVFLFTLEPVYAQTAFESFGAATKLPKTDVITIIARLIRVFLSILGILFVLLIIYAGFLWMKSGGDPAKKQKSINIIKQAIIGFIIIMASYAITTFVINALLRATGGDISSTVPVERYQEPLGGSLGAGIIENHYPSRNALDVPRNTKIFVTFKEPMDVLTLSQGEGQLNASNVWIFETSAGKNEKLGPDAVSVQVSEDLTTFIFDPIDLLGNPSKDTNYTVALQSGIKKQDGKNAFVGAYASGYSWTFEVSTIVDLTPPRVTQVIPIRNTAQPRNVTIEMTFNEPMNPVSTTGTFQNGQARNFTNISVLDSGDTSVEGTFKISNGYKTVGFTSTDACSEDPCGNTIYCLPAGEDIDVRARAATIDTANIPQALVSGVSYDGLTDAAGNSLDGDANGIACGSESNNTDENSKRLLGAKPDNSLNCPVGTRNDHYEWSFSTTGEIEDTVPRVVSASPVINGEQIDQNESVTLSFNTLLQGSSINSQTVSLWPDPLYSMWFVPKKTDNLTTNTTQIEIDHPSFISQAEGGYNYYPVITHGVKSVYQICMYPSAFNNTGCNAVNEQNPYCCNGEPSAVACRTAQDQGTLPGNE